MDTIQTFDEVVTLARLRGPLYLRCSRGPEADAEEWTLDAEAHVTMPGVLVSSLTPEPWWTRPDEDWVARRLCSYLAVQGVTARRKPWLLTGVVVGFGTEHEPLIGAVKPMGWVSAAAVARAGIIYHDRFHAQTVESAEAPIHRRSA